MRKVKKIARLFARDDHGAQIIEYALIIAVVALVLLVALRDVTGANFGGFISRVATCLSDYVACT